jgi:hypothetical protein
MGTALLNRVAAIKEASKARSLQSGIDQPTSPVTFGGIAFGGIAFGGIAFGGLAKGGIAFGGIAKGGIAFGGIAKGGGVKEDKKAGHKSGSPAFGDSAKKAGQKRHALIATHKLLTIHLKPEI